MSEAACHEGAAWRATLIPGSTTPVAVRAAPGEGGLIALVRFPVGWSRPGVGCYQVWEEFLVLSGDLVMNGLHYREGDYAFLPAHHARRDSATPVETLAIARFSGRTRWREGVPGVVPMNSGLVEHRSLHEVARHVGMLGIEARLLRDHDGEQTWHVEARMPAAFPTDVEILGWDAESPRLERVPAGMKTPAMMAPVLVRTG